MSENIGTAGIGFVIIKSHDKIKNYLDILEELDETDSQFDSSYVQINHNDTLLGIEFPHCLDKQYIQKICNTLNIQIKTHNVFLWRGTWYNGADHPFYYASIVTWKKDMNSSDYTMTGWIESYNKYFQVVSTTPTLFPWQHEGLDCGDQRCMFAVSTGGVRASGGCNCLISQDRKIQQKVARAIQRTMFEYKKLL